MEFLNVVILLGALQGFIVSGLLFFYKKGHNNRLLGSLIFLIALACLNLYLLELGLPGESKFWRVFSLTVPLIIVMPIGPLIYFYVRSLIGSTNELKRGEYKHFFLVILDFAPRLVGVLFVISRTADWISPSSYTSWQHVIDLFDTYLDIPRWISTTVYTAMAWKLVRAVNPIKGTEVDLRWARKFVFGFSIFQFLWLLHLVPYVIPSFSDSLLDTVRWYPVYIPLVAIVYWLGANGFLLRAHVKSTSTVSTLSLKAIEETKRMLLQSMERDLLYLDPNLNLSTLVERTGIPQKIISAVLNQQLRKSFNEFVNEYRVEAVKQKLIQGSQHLTITGIAFECGFNSQATFQRAFKSLTGQTPTEYLNESKNRSNSSQI